MKKVVRLVGRKQPRDSEAREDHWTRWASRFTDVSDAMALIQVLEAMSATTTLSARWRETSPPEDAQLTEADVNEATRIILSEVVADAVLSGRAGDAALSAIRLLAVVTGSIVGREDLRAWSTGRKVRDAAAEGGRNRKGVNSQSHEEIRKRAAPLRMLMKAKRPDAKVERQIARRLAADTGFHESTIRRILRESGKKTEQAPPNDPS